MPNVLRQSMMQDRKEKPVQMQTPGALGSRLETLNRAGGSPGEMPCNTSNAERPAAVDDAGSQGEAGADANSWNSWLQTRDA
jgi:hypothetical protein